MTVEILILYGKCRVTGIPILRQLWNDKKDVMRMDSFTRLRTSIIAWCIPEPEVLR